MHLETIAPEAMGTIDVIKIEGVATKPCAVRRSRCLDHSIPNIEEMLVPAVDFTDGGHDKRVCDRWHVAALGAVGARCCGPRIAHAQVVARCSMEDSAQRRLLRAVHLCKAEGVEKRCALGQRVAVKPSDLLTDGRASNDASFWVRKDVNDALHDFPDPMRFTPYAEAPFLKVHMEENWKSG